jgi:hypothetical protein
MAAVVEGNRWVLLVKELHAKGALVVEGVRGGAELLRNLSLRHSV